MARPPATTKRDNEKKKQSKRLEKQQRKEERKSNNSKGSSLEEMFAYVDENGMITSTPPEIKEKKEEIDLESIEISIPRQTEEEAAPSVNKGKVDFFNQSKGFGFIKDSNRNEKYFFHISSLTVPVQEGDTVYFETERGTRGGMNAVNVRLEE